MLRFVGLVCALVMVPAAVALAEAPPYLVTGGGQVVADGNSSDQAGPGDTIAFVAGLDESDRPFGSLQVTDTSEARAGQRPPIIFNGQVTCVEPDGDNAAEFGGVGRTPDGRTRFFTVDVVDTGDEDRGTDTIEFRFTNQPCDERSSGTLLDGTTLARGNLKVDTANSGQ